jgi:flagellar basal body P-ring protein FlgI
LLLLALVGCATMPQNRAQSPEENERAKYEVKTVGDMIDFGDTEPLPVVGVGLVVGLAGTGGNPPPGDARDQLIKQLQQEGVKNTRELLASPETSLVLVSAQIPPGARKDDPLDLEITLPEGSHTTSLRGGYLRECELFTFDSAMNVAPHVARADGAIKGHPYAKAEGPLQVGIGDGDEEGKLRKAKIWGGGHCKVERTFTLQLKSDQQQARVAKVVADRINERFQTPYRASLNSGTAVAVNKLAVVVHVPQQYQHNLPRYLLVVKLIPLREDPNKPHESKQSSEKDSATPAVPYRSQLAADLLNPARSVTAALRLESLGADSVASLKKGLESEHALVRFCSAEALSYLGSSSGAEELARLAGTQPMLRAYCLTALASLNETVSFEVLREMLASKHPDVRYGAFRALRALDDADQAVAGEELHEAFWLHRVAPESEPMIHLCSSRRAEFVLFGHDPMLRAGFVGRAGNFVIHSEEDDTRCIISNGRVRRPCSLKVEDVLRMMADLGATYSESVEIIRQANDCKSLSCRVEVDALPQAVTVQALAKSGMGHGDFLLDANDEEIVKARSEFGTTPNIYAKDSGR